MIFNRCRNLRDAQEVIKKIKLKIVNSFNHISIRKLNKINRLCIPIIIPRGFEDIFKIIKTEIVYNNLSKAWSCTARKNGWLDEHRGKVLRANKGIVLAAVRRYGSIALANVNDERLTNDEEVLFAALRSVMNRDCFEGAGKKARDNKKLALFAVQQHGISLSAASRRLQNNFTVVLTAVRQNGLALEFASDRLKDNDEVVRAAVAQKQSAIRYASPRLQQEGEIHRQVAWAIARGEYTERDSRIGFGCAGIPAL
jgi:hypothetical protein